MKVQHIATQPGNIADKTHLIEYAARISRNSRMSLGEKQHRAFIEKLQNDKHLTPFEFARYVRAYDRPVAARPGLICTQTERITEWLISFNHRHVIEDPKLATLLQRAPVSRNAMTPAQFHAHGAITIEFSGISRACADQVMRYRVNSYVAQSQRFVSATNWVVPRSIANDARALELWEEHHDATLATIEELSELDIPQEDIRALYPMATESKVIVLASPLSWAHFCRQRLDKHAQDEIGRVAVLVKEILLREAPGVFDG